MLEKFRESIRKGDTDFKNLHEYSRAYKREREMEKKCVDNKKDRLMALGVEPGVAGSAATLEAQMGSLPPTELEARLEALAKQRPRITCSSCGRIGHNRSNKFCPEYHRWSNEQKQLEHDRGEMEKEQRFNISVTNIEDDRVDNEEFKLILGAIGNNKNIATPKSKLKLIKPKTKI